MWNLCKKVFEALSTKHFFSVRPAASTWSHTSQYWEWGWMNATAFGEVHPCRPAKVKHVISFSPLHCISFLCQPTGNWKIPKLLNCLFKIDISQSWNSLWKLSWRLDLLVKKDSNPGHLVFVSAEPGVRQWFSPKQPECFYVCFISTFWFPGLPSIPHNILSLCLPITTSQFQTLFTLY